MRRLRITPERWARDAGLHPTTVTRAMSETYESVTSLPTLHALARAANSPSVVDFLEHQARNGGGFRVEPRVMTVLLETTLPLYDPAGGRDQISKMCEALVYGLSLVPIGPDSENEAALRVAAQAAAERFRSNS